MLKELLNSIGFDQIIKRFVYVCNKFMGCKKYFALHARVHSLWI